MTISLSLVAQAVLDTYVDEDRAGRLAVAAVLRAAANDFYNEIGTLPVTEFTNGINFCVEALLAVAAELEGKS
jgi:hypothetical protein